MENMIRSIVSSWCADSFLVKGLWYFYTSRVSFYRSTPIVTLRSLHKDIDSWNKTGEEHRRCSHQRPWSVGTSVRDDGPRRSRFPFISEHPFPKEPSTSSGRSLSNYSPPPLWSRAPKDWPQQDSGGNSIKYKSRIPAYRSSYSSISKSILVYSRRICRDRSGKPRIRNAIHTYFRRNRSR